MVLSPRNENENEDIKLDDQEAVEEARNDTDVDNDEFDDVPCAQPNQNASTDHDTDNEEIIALLSKAPDNSKIG